MPKAPAAGTVDLSGGLVPKAPEPGIMDHVRKLAQAALDLTPVGDLHRSAQAVHDWAAEKASPANPHMQGPLATYGEGVLRDTAGLISGATSPEGVATAGAAVAAPEIVGPAMMVHGVHNMIQSWGSLKNPDVLQNELNSLLILDSKEI